MVQKTAKMSSSCPHIATNGDLSWSEINSKSESSSCDSCSASGPNLWLCLHNKCQSVGCGESSDDHSSSHAESSKHCVTLNLTTRRVWCYSCETEVFPGRNNPPFIIRDDRTGTSAESSPLRGRTSICQGEDSDSDDDGDDRRPRGLTGLQNLGNTCYMNAALQALSNCQPLTQFFMDCHGFVRTDRKPQLSKSYQKLLCELWNRRRSGYVVPSSVLQGIKIVHPMFRGYAQQDTQEFLRCFMDQIHEELKEPAVHGGEHDDVTSTSDYHSNDGRRSNAGDTTSLASVERIGSVTSLTDEPTRPGSQSEETNRPIGQAIGQSESEYETCDSGLSSERSSVEHNIAEEAEEREKRRRRSRDSQERDEPNGHPHPSGLPDIIDDHKERNQTDNEKDIDESEPDNDKSAKNTTAATTTTTVKNSNVNNDVTDQSANQRPVHPEADMIGRRVRLSSTRSVSSDADWSSRLKAGLGSSRTVQFRSVISDIFDGKLLSSVQCLTCERISSTKETFQDLSLPIPSKDHVTYLHSSHPGQVTKGTCGEVHLNQSWMTWMFYWMRSWFWGPVITLQDCLAAFFSADDLKGDNMYSCEKCKKLRNGVKFSKVLELPEVLCIHLKRLRHEFMFSNKISAYVSFPLEGLDMGPYLHKDCTSRITQYDLAAVICHRGNAGGGHYIAYAINHASGRWYEYDDQCVSQVDDRVVENCEAYVLFYRKRQDHMITHRQRAMELIDPYEESLMQFYISRQWVNRFNTFAEPGPVCNHDFLCQHGGVPPHKLTYVEELVQPVSRPLWEFIYQEFGGGPAVNHLHPCDSCQAELDQMVKRQKFEMETFMKLNSAFKEEENPALIYAISMAWFKDWEAFVRGKASEPAGPVDNSRISYTKNGVPMLRLNSDYGQVSEETWRFLHSIYGGGPELVLKDNSSQDAPPPRSPPPRSPPPRSPSASPPGSLAPPGSSPEPRVGEAGDGARSTLAELASQKV